MKPIHVCILLTCFLSLINTDPTVAQDIHTIGSRNLTTTLRSSPMQGVNDEDDESLQRLLIDLDDDFYSVLEGITKSAFRPTIILIIAKKDENTIRMASFSRTVWSGNMKGEPAIVTDSNKAVVEQAWAISNGTCTASKEEIVATCNLIWTNEVSGVAALSMFSFAGKVDNQGRVRGNCAVSTPIRLPKLVAEQLVRKEFERSKDVFRSPESTINNTSPADLDE